MSDYDCREAEDNFGSGEQPSSYTRIAHLDADVSSRLATSGYTAPPSAVTIAGDVWDVVLSGHLTAGTTGSALNGAGAAGDPWQTALPGAYGAGTAGNIVGTNLDAAVSSRLATSGYTAPDNTDIASIKTTLGVAGAGLTALGDTRMAHLDADISSRLATSGYTAPDNTDIVAIKAKTDNLPASPADESVIVAAFSAVASEISAVPAAPTAIAVANEVASRTLNANIKEINSVTITGDGSTTPFGPA